MKGVVKKMCFPSYSLFHQAARAALLAFLLCVFVSGTAVKSKAVLCLWCTQIGTQGYGRSKTDMSYHVSERHHTCAQCWPGIQRITAGKQYCKYQWLACQHSRDIGFRCIVEAFFFMISLF